MSASKKRLHGSNRTATQKSALRGHQRTGTLALTAASIFGDISLTIAMTPSDFVWQGFMQGKKDGCKEWPIEGESLFSYKGKPLPYMPFCYQHPDYWRIISEESKRTGNMIASRKLFDDSEAAHPITEEEFDKGREYPRQAVSCRRRGRRTLGHRKIHPPHGRTPCERNRTPAKSRRSYMSTARILFSPTVCSRPCCPSARHCLSSWRSALRMKYPRAV